MIQVFISSFVFTFHLFLSTLYIFFLSHRPLLPLLQHSSLCCYSLSQWPPLHTELPSQENISLSQTTERGSSNMLDGLLGRGFAPKCKSLMKLTKTRIDVIRRKRRATEKFLKKDIADLLMNGLDINAYGRADGLLVELILSSCYDFIERCCEFVLKHLPVMQKLSGCPEECREAVSSLMFAAARFSDLPELRDLRQIFQERYGSSLECYVNQQFAANLNFNSSTLEKKVCLMQEIASDFSIKWDSKAFEMRMSKSSAIEKGHNTCLPNHMSDHDKPSHAKDATTTEVKYGVLSPDHPNVGYRFQNGKEAVVLNKHDNDLQSRSTFPGNVFKPLNGVEVTQKRDDRDDNRLTRRQDITSKKSDRDYWKEGCMLNGVEVTQKRDGHDNNPLTECQDITSKKIDKDYWKEGSMLNGVEVTQKRDGKDNNPLKGWQDITSKKSDRGYWKDGSMLKPAGHSSQEKTVEQFEGGSKLHDDWGNSACLRENHDTATPICLGLLFKGNMNEPFSDNHAALPNTNNSYRKVENDEILKLKPSCNNAIPPPYVKPNSKLQNKTHGVNLVSSHIDCDGISTCPSEHDKPEAASRSQVGFDDSDQDWQASRHERRCKQSHEKDFSTHEDVNEVPVLLKPKSMRRKPSKSQSSHNDVSNEYTGLRRKSRSRSRRRNEPRCGLQTMFDDERLQNAEEDRMIDKLLLHYSKKPSILVPEKLKRHTKNRHAHPTDNSSREFLQNEIRDGSDDSEEVASFPPRSVSLPREQTATVKVKKVYARAATFQPDRSNDARHVHPKLPDYEDLAARFAALRGR